MFVGGAMDIIMQLLYYPNKQIDHTTSMKEVIWKGFELFWDYL